jgi:hypothetical protein
MDAGIIGAGVAVAVAVEPGRMHRGAWLKLCAEHVAIAGFGGCSGVAEAAVLRRGCARCRRNVAGRSLGRRRRLSGGLCPSGSCGVAGSQHERCSEQDSRAKRRSRTVFGRKGRDRRPRGCSLGMGLSVEACSAREGLHGQCALRERLDAVRAVLSECRHGRQRFGRAANWLSARAGRDCAGPRLHRSRRRCGVSGHHSGDRHLGGKGCTTRRVGVGVVELRGGAWRSGPGADGAWAPTTGASGSTT